VEEARLATEADLSRVAELCRRVRSEMAPLRGGAVFLAREARPEPVEESLAGAMADRDRRLVVGTIDDFPVGYGLARVEELRGGGRLGVIEDIYVEEGARGVGVGEAMVGLLLEWLHGHDVVGVDAHALPGDRNTKNFFETAGFTARLLVMHQKADR
jgi:GNAT superfamily N-acetyltransferase